MTAPASASPWLRMLRWLGLARPPAAVASPPAAPAGLPDMPAPAAIAGLPDGARPPAPWEGAEAAVSFEADAVRTALVARLFEAVDRAASEGDRAFLTRLIRDCGAARLDFPLFPDAALRLDALLRRGDPSVSSVADVVKREPDLVRRVWQQASGVAYGGRPPASLDAAIVRIGFDALWRIGMSACTNAPVFRVRGYESSANHVRGVSIVASETAPMLLPGPEPFLGALLYGVGRLLFYRCAVVRPGQPAPDPACVEDAARRWYPSVGVLIADAWGFGPGVAAGVGFAPDPSRAPEEHRAVARAVRAAHVAALTTSEARAGRDVGGLAELLAIAAQEEPGALRFDPARVVAAADAAWTGVQAAPPDAAPVAAAQ
jgi:hypothetical protein